MPNTIKIKSNRWVPANKRPKSKERNRNKDRLFY